MAGGSGDWNNLLDKQSELIKEAKGANKYSKIAAASGIIAVLLAIIALFN
jgi:hypothetical protein